MIFNSPHGLMASHARKLLASALRALIMPSICGDVNRLSPHRRSSENYATNWLMLYHSLITLHGRKFVCFRHDVHDIDPRTRSRLWAATYGLPDDVISVLKNI